MENVMENENQLSTPTEGLSETPESPTTTEATDIRDVAETSQRIHGALDDLTQTVEEMSDLISEEGASPQSPPMNEPRVRTRYSQDLVVHHQRSGKAAEEFRTLRTNLLARCADERLCFLVTSAERGEGKTVSCLNLALVLAERLDRRTIVVDFDLRNRRVAKMFNGSAGPGIADILRGTESLDQVIQSTSYPNLSFIGAGRAHANQAGELLSQAAMKTIVDQLKQEYDYVLVDTPAINEFSDAGVAGLTVRKALLVVRLNRTPQEQVEQAIQALRNAQIDLIGIIMTHQRRHLLN